LKQPLQKPIPIATPTPIPFAGEKGIYMRIHLFFLLIVTAAASVYGDEWYENLPPGITRTEILQMAGNPSSTKSANESYYNRSGKVEYAAQIDRYDLKEGYVELKYDKNVLMDGNQYSEQGRGLKILYTPRRIPQVIDKRTSQKSIAVRIL
jgi:hypothetical protein